MSTTNTTTPTESGMRTFRVPRLIYENRNLRRLSGNALRLYLFISHRAYRTRLAQVQSTNYELLIQLDMDTEEVRAAFRELRDCHLIDVTLESPLIIFHLLHPDSSRAKNYLREQPAQTQSLLKQD